MLRNIIDPASLYARQKLPDQRTLECYLSKHTSMLLAVSGIHISLSRDLYSPRGTHMAGGIDEEMGDL